jgi:mono/diheme cytochrome c family protein
VTGYSFALFLHSTLRWAVVFAGALALGSATHGWWRRRAYAPSDERAHRAFVGLTDLQFLLGIGLYFFLSPFVDAFWHSPRVAMKESTLRFFGIEHVTTMVAAVLVLHVGRVRAKKALTDSVRFRRLALTCFVALALMGAGIPWPGLRHGRPLSRWPSAPTASAPHVLAARACPDSFVARCSACHGVDGAGDGPGAAALRPPPRSFRAPGWDRGRSDAALEAVVRDGGARHGLSAAMPGHADLSDGEIRDLVRCVRGFQQRSGR